MRDVGGWPCGTERLALGLAALMMLAGCLPRETVEEALDPDEDGVLGPWDCDSFDPQVTNIFTGRDLDGDGFADEATKDYACAVEPGYSDVFGDCDDGNAASHPEAVEICDDEDNDCDGVVDEEVADLPGAYRDGDGDGYGVDDDVVLACDPPEGYAALAGDCDDGAPLVNPAAAPKDDDDIDNNCDGLGDNAGPLWATPLEVDPGGGIGADYGLIFGESGRVWSHVTFGDVTGDGVDDVIASDTSADKGDGLVVIWAGPVARGVSEADAWAVVKLVGEGEGLGVDPLVADYDEDGILDLAFGAPDATYGSVMILFGPLAQGTIDPTDTRDGVSIGGISRDDQAGASLALTDWNSDDVVDLIIGAPGVDTFSGAAGKDSGAVYIVLGPITQSRNVGTDAIATTTRAGGTDANLGVKVTHIGDLDGDGRPELAYAMPTYDYSGVGEAEVVIIEPDEGTEDISSAMTWLLRGGAPAARLGIEMCGAGDVNLDGYADLLIANPTGSSEKGGVYLLPGSRVQLTLGSGGTYDLSADALTKFTGSQSGEGLGASLACPGDVNGDGHAEIALGSPGHDLRSSSPTYDYGAVFVWFGPTPSGSLAPEDADSSLSTSDREAGLGAVLGTGGDVNGLGWIDLAASAGGGEDLVIWTNDRF
jgi:hypothetical protein